MKSAPKSKAYKMSEEKPSQAEEPIVGYITTARVVDSRLKNLLGHEGKAHTLVPEIDLIQLIRNGISKKSLDHLISQIGYSITDIASVLHISDRNLRRYEPKDKLGPEQSERLVEIAKLYAKGEEVFGSINSFNQWMNAEILALGNLTPKSFLDTSIGIQLLGKELGRIEHGILA
jgi:putative toxin-antitoxin system antitoxin component (TIGR02293 family)